MRSLFFIGTLGLISGCSLMPTPNVLEFQMSRVDVNSNVFFVKKVIPHTWSECSGIPQIHETGKGYIDDPKGYKRRYVIASRCRMIPENYIPEEIVIDYAPWLSQEQQDAKGLSGKPTYIIGDRVWNGQVTKGAVLGEDEEAVKYNLTILPRLQDEDIGKIPASAWHRVVLHPQELVEKYRYTDPKGDGVRSRGKLLLYTIHLDKDGTSTVSDQLLWVSPISHNWGQ